MAAGAGLTWLTSGPLGPALTVLASLVGAITALALSLIYRRYIAILAASAKRSGSRERLAYEVVRTNLIVGTAASRIYSQWLTWFLAAVDRFFGDTDKADNTAVVKRALGVKLAEPRWTASALDRCLLIALMYPLASLFVIWVASGHVGPAEAALGLKADLNVGWRAIIGVCVGFGIFLLWDTIEVGAGSFERMFPLALIFISGGPVLLALGFALSGIARRYARPGSIAFTRTLAFSLPVSVAMGKLDDPAYATLYSGRITEIVRPIAILILGMGLGFYFLFSVVFFYRATLKKHMSVLFLSLFFPIMTIICIILVGLLGQSRGWRGIGGILLFFGLLTLLNAPFDWLSLGLTRTLLRLGLRRGGWYPALLGLADAIVIGPIVGCLSIAMVLTLRIFNAVSNLSGGSSVILPVDELMAGIAARPMSPEYWWIYSLLLTTMIPSVLNLMIGGASLTRGLPGVPSLLLRWMPEGKTVLPWDRHWMAAVLTGQIAVGAFLGLAAQIAIAIGVFGYGMPQLGLGVLDLAQEVANLDLPARVVRLLPR